MLRAIFMIGLFAMLGLFAVGMVFKLFGGIIGLTFFIVGFAIKVLIVGGLAVPRNQILSPGTAAARYGSKWSGTSSQTATRHVGTSRHPSQRLLALKRLHDRPGEQAAP